MLNINQIKEIIPHRYPFLLIDRVVELDAPNRCVALKNVSANEPFFQGHFPNEPVMPGVLIMEALAQVGAVAILSLEENRGKTAYFGAMNKVRFREKVVPGDQLELEVEILALKGSVGKGKGTARVNGKVVCEGEMTFGLSAEADV